MRPGVNTRAGGGRAAGGRRPAGVSRGRPLVLLAGKPDAGPVRHHGV